MRAEPDKVDPVQRSASSRLSEASVVQSSRAVGRRGEDIAARYLQDCGWQILDRNWRPASGRRGELDLVAWDPRGTGQGGTTRDCGATVVVEVKTRTNSHAGTPAEAVSRNKMARLRGLAGAWAAAHAPVRGALRVDVISVLLRSGEPALLHHHRGVGS